MFATEAMLLVDWCVTHPFDKVLKCFRRWIN